MKNLLLFTLSLSLFFLFSFTWQGGNQADVCNSDIQFAISSVLADDDVDKKKRKNENDHENSEDRDSDKDNVSRVTVCHVPPGNAEGEHHTIAVSKSALSAHLSHGDTVDACPSCICPPGVSSCICADGMSGSPGSSVVSNLKTLRSIHGGS